MSLCTLITLPFILWIAFDKSPEFVKKLDAERCKSILPMEKDLKQEMEFEAEEASEKKEKDTEKTS